MTAWDLLVQHSTLSTGTALEHLNAQSGMVIMNDGIHVELPVTEVQLDLQLTALGVELSEPVLVELDTSVFEAVVQDDPATPYIVDTDLEAL